MPFMPFMSLAGPRILRVTGVLGSAAKDTGAQRTAAKTLPTLTKGVAMFLPTFLPLPVIDFELLGEFCMTCDDFVSSLKLDSAALRGTSAATHVGPSAERVA